MNNRINNSQPKGKYVYIILVIIMIICLIIIIASLISGLGDKNDKKKYSPILIPSNIYAHQKLESPIHYKPSKVNMGRFSISMWLYIENWNYNIGKNKIILNGNNKNLVYLDEYKNDLIFNLNLFNKNTKGNNFKPLKLKDIPLQKWNNIILILKDRTVEMYLDGRLEKTYLVQYVPKPIHNLDVLPTNSDNPRQGFYGQISKLQYFNKALNYTQIQNIFQDGPY